MRGVNAATLRWLNRDEATLAARQFLTTYLVV